MYIVYFIEVQLLLLLFSYVTKTLESLIAYKTVNFMRKHRTRSWTYKTHLIEM